MENILKIQQNTENPEITEQSLSQNPPKKQSSTKSKFPVNLFVDYQLNQLRFQWNLATVRCPQGAYFRNVIIFDINTFQNFDSIFETIQIFYKRLKLGDFMKVMYAGADFKKDWIEKTSQKLQKQHFTFQKLNKISVMECSQAAVKLSKRLGQTISISLISYNLNKQTIIQLTQFKKKSNKQIHIFNLFFTPPENKQNVYWLNSELELYEFRKKSELQEKFKIFIHDQNKIRALSTEIKLTCRNGDILLQDNKENCWVLEKGSLYNRVYAINNYTKYSCSIIINSLKLKQLDMNVQFTLNFIGKSKFRMSKQFVINSKTSNFSFEQIKSLMQYEFKDNRYSEMPKNIKVDFSRGQKILITQKTNQRDYLSYQEQLFRN